MFKTEYLNVMLFFHSLQCFYIERKSKFYSDEMIFHFKFDNHNVLLIFDDDIKNLCIQK